MYYSIFAGTNSLSELGMALKFLSTFRFKDKIVLDSFHSTIKEVISAKYAFSFGSGRMCLYIALKALGIGEGDEVILPAYTCIVVVNAIRYAGAKPVYVDIDPVSFNIDASKIETAITNKTKAILAQHTFGLLCGVEAIRKIADKYKLKIIEDSALAMGVEHKGVKVGSLGDIAYFSTDNSKVISSFCGGFVTTNDSQIGEQLQKLWGQTPWLGNFHYFRIGLSFILAYFLFDPRVYRWTRYLLRVFSKFRVMFYFRDELKLEKPKDYRYPSRMSSLQAGIAESQLLNLSKNIEHRQKIGMEAENFVGWLGGKLEKNASNHCFLRYSFLVPDREIFLKNFSSEYDLGIWFTSVLHGRHTDLESVGYKRGTCPVAEDVARRIVNIPTHLRIPHEGVIAALKQALQKTETFVPLNSNDDERLVVRTLT